MTEEEFIATVLQGLNEELVTVDNYNAILDDIVEYYVLPPKNGRYVEVSELVTNVINYKLKHNGY